MALDANRRPRPWAVRRHGGAAGVRWQVYRHVPNARPATARIINGAPYEPFLSAASFTHAIALTSAGVRAAAGLPPSGR